VNSPQTASFKVEADSFDTGTTFRALRSVAGEEEAVEAVEAEETASAVNVVCSLWMLELSVQTDMNDHLRKVCHDNTTASRADASDAITVVLSVLL